MPDTETPSLADMVRQYRDGHRFDDEEVNFRCASLIDAGFVPVPGGQETSEPRHIHLVGGAPSRECAG
ncbi:MAG: hypothetical protein M0003_10605 [Acidithiobacillus sp.]|jgi:hypothetical protein|nr:hypothetical protein [Acidithiobacillus sp.]